MIIISITIYIPEITVLFGICGSVNGSLWIIIPSLLFLMLNIGNKFDLEEKNYKKLKLIAWFSIIFATIIGIICFKS